MVETVPDIIVELETKVLGHLDGALGMELKLSGDDGDYSLQFVRQKLALCSTFQERLSDIMMKLTRISIDVTKQMAASRYLHEAKVAEVKASGPYKDAPREHKGNLLRANTQEEQNLSDRWITLRRVVSEIKEAIGERAQTMKRLDSDLRLHSRLLEMVPPENRGSTSPTSFTGSRPDNDLEIS